MTAWIRRLALGVVLGGFVAVVSSDGNVATAADDKKVPDVETIMKKVNGKKGLTAKVNEAAKGEKWDEAQKSAKELKELTAALGKNDPHKGDKASWAKLAKQYADEGAAIADAAEKKDAKALGTASKAFSGACKTCHDTHK